MIATVEKSLAKGCIYAPPSKSMSHRALIAAGLAEGESVIKGIMESEDVLATLEAICALGCKYEKIGDDTIKVIGSKEKHPVTDVVNCRESGSTLRFFIPLFLKEEKEVLLKGYGRLMERPMGIYEEICQTQGLTLSKDAEGMTLKGPLQPGEFSVPGNVSSQFISGLLFALPLLLRDSVIHLIPPVESKPYISMTIQVLQAFGVEIDWKDNAIYIKGNQHYRAREYQVEGDYSNAAFLEGFNLIGGEVEVKGLLKESLQGDRIYQKMYPMLLKEAPVLDLTDCPDLGPVLMAMAAAHHGARFTGAERLKIKESDRGAAMMEELAKFGIKAYYQGEDIVVEKGTLQKPTQMIGGHNDHRVVMANTLLLSLCGGQIDDAQAVNKSYPLFWKDMEKLGIKVELDENEYYKRH